MSPEKGKSQNKITLQDIYSEAFELIGIISQLEDFRLAYLINQALDISLIKTKEIEIFFKKEKHKFTHFEFDDAANFCYWRLIENKSLPIDTKTAKNNSLFDEIESHRFFLPEMKNYDYFLKIEEVDEKFDIKNALEKLQNINGIKAVIQIDKNKIKTKTHLSI